MNLLKHLVIVLLFSQITLLNAQCWDDISVGSFHVLALKSDGTIWTWGENVYGQLGIGNIVDKNKPVQVGIDKDWKSIETGTHHCFAIKSDGSMWAWGSNSKGELGIESMSTYKNKPVQVGLDKDWEIVSSGQSSTYAIKKDGTLWGWGGVLGAISNQLKPIQIGSENKWKSVSNCTEHILLLKTNGTLWSIGKNYYGQLGLGIFSNNVDTLSQIGFNDDWEFILADEGVSFGMVSGGTTRIWGRLNSDENRTWNTPRDPFGVRHYWKNITANRYNFCGLKDDGTLWGCGNNEHGQLSNGSKTKIPDPTQIGSESNWSKVVVGTYGNTFAIKKDGSLWTCGRNDKGQLGNGTYTDTANFILVTCPAVNSASDQNSIESDISIYPNPFKNNLVIDLKQNQTFIYDILINDLTGKLVYSNLNNKTNTSKINIYLDELPKGIYFLNAKSNFSNVNKIIFKN